MSYYPFCVCEFFLLSIYSRNVLSFERYKIYADWNIRNIIKEYGINNVQLYIVNDFVLTLPFSKKMCIKA